MAPSMITSAARLCQLSPFNSVQTEAVPRIGSRGSPRNVKLQARSEPPSRSVNPSASDVCASEMPLAVPARFQIECCPGHRRVAKQNDAGTVLNPQIEMSDVEIGRKKRLQCRPIETRRTDAFRVIASNFSARGLDRQRPNAVAATGQDFG